MSKLKPAFLTFLILLFTNLIFPLYSFAQTTPQEETLTITTYYPAPYGVYNELRSKRMAIGDTYYDGSRFCWPGGSCTTAIDTNADLIVEGNVGIGTTEPIRLLHLFSPSVSSEIIMEVADSPADYRKWNIGAGFGSPGSYKDFFIRQLNDAGTGGPERLFINGYTGNVGIGTTGPGAKLHINALTGDTSLLNIVATVPGIGTVAQISETQADGILLGLTGDSDGDAGGPFQTVFLKNGNVGIGTASPQGSLEIVRGSTDDLYPLRISGPGNQCCTDIVLGWNNTTPTTGKEWLIYSRGSDGSFKFARPGAASAISIAPSDYVGIGEEAPQNILHISGAGISGGQPDDPVIRVNVENTVSNTGLRFTANNDMNSRWEIGRSGSSQDSGNFYLFGGNNRVLTAAPSGNVGIGTVSPGYTLTVAGTAWVTSGVWTGSDRRWKKDITPLNDSLSKIMKLQGVNYDWKVEEFPDLKFSAGRQVGLIAQDTEKVIPEVVTTDDNGYKGISYEKLTPILVEAIKEQQKQMEDIKAENVALKVRIDKLENKVN